MNFPKSSKQKLLLIGVSLAVVAMIVLALRYGQRAEPLGAADQKYREVIVRAIREGKREFSAPTQVRVQIIVQAAEEAGWKTSTEQLGEGARVYLSRP
jgi:hypothetical protein